MSNNMFTSEINIVPYFYKKKLKKYISCFIFIFKYFCWLCSFDHWVLCSFGIRIECHIGPNTHLLFEIGTQWCSHFTCFLSV